MDAKAARQPCGHRRRASFRGHRRAGRGLSRCSSNGRLNVLASGFQANLTDPSKHRCPGQEWEQQTSEGRPGRPQLAPDPQPIVRGGPARTWRDPTLPCKNCERRFVWFWSPAVKIASFGLPFSTEVSVMLLRLPRGDSPEIQASAPRILRGTRTGVWEKSQPGKGETGPHPTPGSALGAEHRAKSNYGPVNRLLPSFLSSLPLP